MMRFRLVILCLLPSAAGAETTGSTLYQQRCAACHSEANSRAPGLDAMRTRTPESIVTTLSSGAMRAVGAKLSGAERRQVAEFISGKAIAGDVTGATAGRCSSNPPFRLANSEPRWAGFSPTSANTRFQPAGQAGLAADQVPKLRLKWAFGFPDATAAWAQPTVAGGRVFVGSQNGTVYSLDAKTGCVYWAFSAAGGVRTAVVLGSGNVYFGDTAANVYAVNAATGERVWSQRIDDHPLARITGSPVLYDGRLYVGVSSYEESQGASPDYECCSFRGSLAALDIAGGRILWKTYTIAVEPKPRGDSKRLWGPSGAAIWSAPTIDPKRRLVYAATGNTYSGPSQPSSDAVIAFDMETGKVRWMRQATPNDTFVSGCRSAAANPNCPAENGPDFDFGNAPMLTAAGGRDLIVIGQKSGIGYALDPDHEGQVVWQYRAGQGGPLGGLEWGSATDGDNAYFPVSDITRPQPGGLHAVNLRTGERVWYAPPPPLACAAGRGCSAAQTAAITAIPGAVFSGSNDGALRAYSTRDGSILWTFDTNREFETVNRIPARGASMHGPGPAVAGGMLFVNSGYGAFGGRPGNVLLAFAPE